MQPARIVTHGCRANLAERDALAALAAPGQTVINSCAVTAGAERDARAAARAALKQGPVVVTGCAATYAPARFADLSVTLVPNARKFMPEAWGATGQVPPAVTRQSRAFVSVQDGCDHDCTFCVTRLARGPSRSVPLVDVVQRVRQLADAGVAEVVLTGIDTTSYGDDLVGRPRLGALVQTILRDIPSLPRLRLSSLDAAEADDGLVDAFASEARLMPHVHLSLQSGDDLVLKRMKRRHSRADALRLVARLKAARSDIAIGCDLIAGFPTEGEAAHAASLSLLDEADIVHAHIFPYSPRAGTAAARMPQLPRALVKARAAELRATADQRHHSFLARHIGLRQSVVSEGKRGCTATGATLNFRVLRPKGTLAMVVANRIEAGQLHE